ncbi:MAG: peptidoglycan DD-metalloendopeptidase family protein [bacterium]
MTHHQGKILIGILIMLITGCVEMGSNAPIDDRTEFRDRKLPKPKPPEPQIADAPGFYTVKKGDNLMKISLQFNQNWRDIVDWNTLSNPNDIKVGQVLRIVPPEGAQLAAVPMDNRLELRPLDTRPAANAVSAISSVKTLPSGSKVMYTDQAWADMQRGEASPARSLDSPRKLSDSSVGSAKFSWPTEGKVVSTFDSTRKGIDIAGQLGQPIISAGDGTVLYAKNMRGYGNLVILDHNDGLVSAYAHNKNILVKEGQTVTRGQKIAEMGNSDSDSVKLHFEIRQLGKPVDPMGMLPGR